PVSLPFREHTVRRLNNILDFFFNYFVISFVRAMLKPIYLIFLPIVLSVPNNRVIREVDSVEQVNSQSTEMTPSTSQSAVPCHDLSEHRGIPQLVFPMCTSTNGLEGLRNVVIHGMACTCDLNTHDVHKRDDYQYTPGIGAHKLHTRGATFNNARRICNEEGGNLAIIDSLAEERVLLDLFKRAVGIRNVTNEDQALIGIHDLFSEGEWVTILGESLHKNGYTKWSDRWGGQPDNGGGVQNCGSLLKEGGMDDVSCNAQFAFFCEIPGIRIAH
ncbi:hypothetical protein G9C98_004162, partial [Cotesia typhae]